MFCKQGVMRMEWEGASLPQANSSSSPMSLLASYLEDGLNCRWCMLQDVFWAYLTSISCVHPGPYLDYRLLVFSPFLIGNNVPLAQTHILVKCVRILILLLSIVSESPQTCHSLEPCSRRPCDCDHGVLNYLLSPWYYYCLIIHIAAWIFKTCLFRMDCYLFQVTCSVHIYSYDDI